jgi:rhodanese-related sulfurtransferase
MKNITKEEWKELLPQEENAVILDVRTPEECAEGIIPTAGMLNFFESDKFVATVAEMDKNKSYYIYCRSGNRSGQACQIMDQMGFGNTYNLIGGMMDWDGAVVK